MSQFTPKKRPVVLCVLDGWGIGDGGQYDAIASANTPCFDEMIAQCPNTTLEASGGAVGLPDGQMGNSEVGHMNIGAGRVVMQYLPRISNAFQDDEVKDYKAICALVARLKESGKACHIMGLMSDGGVHSHMDHVIGLAKIMGSAGVKTHIHAFTDGRDRPPEACKRYIAQTMLDIYGHDNISVSSIGGRYYGMDRTKKWDRIERAYDAIVLGQAQTFNDPVIAMQKSYDAGKTDEFVDPMIVNGYGGIAAGDAIIFANFRNDRARQLCNALMFDDFDGFERKGGKPAISKALSMVPYSVELDVFMEPLFLPLEYKNHLGEVVSAAGLKQIRLAETEKYPHVTFFFNCGREEPFEGEERILVDSPSVATYDLQPEMSAPEISKHLLNTVAEDKHDLIIVNFANADMVGHTGFLDAVKQGIETVDQTLCKLRALVLEKGGVLLVTADHGNAEMMFDETVNGPHTAHTTNLVPLIIAGAGDGISLKEGKLGDLAPTMLHFLGIDQPEEMDGVCLIK